MRTILRVLGLALLPALLAAVVWAQGGATGAITGQVVDPSGAVVPGASVRIVNHATGQVARLLKTDASGSFTALLLPVASYDVTVSAPGFAKGTVNSVDVRITETTRMTAKLVPQTVQQQVEVQGEVETVETSTATTGQSIEANTIRSLPLATQNFQQLLTLSAGTNSSLNASASLGRGDVRIEVNGQREDNNNYLIEGISATDYNVAELTNTPLPSPDVVQEFKVQTSLYDATQGRNGGGNINAILKGGSLRFHGDLFEFFRNDALNANEFFLKARNQPRPVVKQNIFGGSLGGPVGKQGKLGFFFVNYQGTRQRSGLSTGTIISTIIPSLPTDRSASSLATAFLGGPQNAGLIDPVALKLLNIKSDQFGGAGGGWLIPSVPNGQLTISHPGKYTDDQFTANWDREFRGGKDHLAERFFFSDFESLLPFGAGGLTATLGGTISPTDLNFPLDMPVHDRFFSLAETHVFTPQLLNELRFGFVHINNDAINTPIVTVDQLGIDRPNSNLYKTIYKFELSTFRIGPTPGADQSQLQNNFTWLDTVSWTKGKHRLRFGGEYDRIGLDKNFPQTFNGDLFFAPSAEAPGGLPSSVCPGGSGCSDFQNLLLGAPYFSFGGSGVSNHEYRINDYAFFGQDDVSLTPNFTLNAGLRLEITGAVRDNLNHIGNTVSALALQGQSPFIYPTGVNSLHIPGFTGNASPTTMLNNYARNWGPRIGFAYDVGGHHTTSVRAGYGIFYVREDVGTIDQLSFTTPILPITFAAGPPGTMATLFATGPGKLPKGGVIDPAYIPVYSNFLGFVDCSTGLPTADTTQCPTYGGNTISLFGLEVPRHFVSPNTQQWNLTVQRELKHDWILELGYVGAKGTHLRETRDNIQARLASPQNPIVLTNPDGSKAVITQNTITNANARSPAPGLAPSGYQLFANDAYSHYHSLQASLTHHISKGIYLQTAYTFSKSTDATSSGNTAFNTAINDQTSLVDSRGLSDFDRTHRLVVSYVWDLPAFSSAKGFRGGLLNNWSLSGVVTFQSGVPFTIIDSAGGVAYSLSSPNTTTADLAPGATVASALSSGGVEQRLDNYVKLSAFAPVPLVPFAADGVSTGYGNLGRNIYRGPFQQNWDFSLTKMFRITEGQSVRFGADFFNLWNHPSFNAPSFTDIENTASFGHITSTAGTPRLIQFSLRYAF
jgi:hypothetical protein